MTLHVETGTDNKILRTVSAPVEKITGELRMFALDMVRTMLAEKGVGLAAPQVGRNIRLIVCTLNPGEKDEAYVPMLNPAILEKSDKAVLGEEGCLSLPKTWGQVKRAKEITVSFTDFNGKTHTIELEDFNARVVQHEIDHLDGILFIDKAKNIKENNTENVTNI
ncbi:peptide deformylase [Patescibacteria group bacterium]|nr:peptide deformylase [Patescibacteria group bacterium]